MDDRNEGVTTGASRGKRRGLDHAMLLIAGAGLIAFWALIGLMWVEM